MQSEFSSYLSGRVQFKHSVDRAAFEALINPTVQETVRLTRTFLDAAVGDGQEPDSLVLIGGSTQIPLVERLLRKEVPIEPVKWKNATLPLLGGGIPRSSLVGIGSWAIHPQPRKPSARPSAKRSRQRAAPGRGLL